MIKGKKKVTLTQENILKRISEYDIFKMYMPGDWKVNQLTHSPFREDKEPSFLISNRYGSLGYIDYGSTEHRGDCVHFVRQLFNLPSLDATLRKIDQDFSLGISSGKLSNDYKQIIKEYKQPESIGKRYTKIQVQPKKFTKMDLDYWNLFYQDVSDLKRENIYSVAKIFLNKKRFSFDETQPIFGYFYEGDWKIYRPFETKKRKWLPNNVPITVMDGKDCIKDADIAFINKSKKDYMVIRKLLPTTCAVQNEGVACFTPENVKFLRDNSKKQILSFDSDTAGVKSSLQITDMFGFDYCNVPKKYLAEGINDWAGLAQKYNLDIIEKYLIDKQILI
jgi:hypothetical protein